MTNPIPFQLSTDTDWHKTFAGVANAFSSKLMVRFGESEIVNLDY